MEEEQHICDYGCGQIAKFKMTSGKWCCEDFYAKCSAIRKINSEKNRDRMLGVRGKDHPHYGKKHTEEAKNKIRVAHIGMVPSEESRIKNKEAHIGKKASQETKNKMSKSHLGPKNHFYGKHHTEKTKKVLSLKTSNNRKGFKHTEKTKQKLRKILTGRIVSLETRKKQSIKMKAKFKDKEFLKKYRKSLALKPNKQESFLIELLDKILNGKYKYVGDYSYWIDGKNPDFINEENNKIIEFFGKYWHDIEITGKTKEENEIERIEHFKNNGYKTLVIWDRELKNIDELTKKILEFERS